MHEEYEDVPNIPGAEKHKYKPKSGNSPDNSVIAPARRLSAELSAVITITNPFEPEHISNFLAFTPPPREWLLGTVICRTFLTVMSASGGTGKSALVIIWAIALATERAIAGFHIHKRARVMILTFEDTADEYRRRFAAAFMQHGLDHKEADGYLYVKSLNGIGVTIGSVQYSRTEGPTVLPTSAPGLIEDVISRLNINVITLDPFVKCSGVPENDNIAVDGIVKILAGICERRNVACVVLHHNRKGQHEPGNMETSRGASSLVIGTEIRMGHILLYLLLDGYDATKVHTMRISMRMRDIAQTQIRLTPQTRKRLDELVECDGRRMQKVMQDLIEYAVEHPEILRARMMERLARIEGRSGEAA